MNFSGVEWFPVAHPAAVLGWAAFKHPKREIVMLVRGEARNFLVRGQRYSTWAAARRMAP